LGVLVDQVVLPSGRRCFPVMEEDRLHGLLTLNRIKQVPRQQWPTIRVEEVMIPKAELETVKPDDALAEVFERMTSEDLNQFPVVDEAGGGLLGLVARDNVRGAFGLGGCRTTARAKPTDIFGITCQFQDEVSGKGRRKALKNAGFRSVFDLICVILRSSASRKRFIV